MIQQLNRRIQDIARQLQGDYFIHKQKRARLQAELSKLIRKRDVYFEFTGKERPGRYCKPPDKGRS